jgi:hypothetical protein
MGGLSSLLGATNPATAAAGMAANVVGGVLNVVGAVGQKNEAKKQLAAQKGFSNRQRLALSSGYGDLINQAKGAPTYQGDISRYLKNEGVAEMNKRMLSGGQVAGEGILRDQARQTTANTLAAARLGAGSGSDLLTAALMGQNQENVQMQSINVQSQQQRQQMQQVAQQGYMAALGQTAAAQAQQLGLEFGSQQQKANQLLGLGREQLGQTMALEEELFGAEQAKAAALQQARSAIWSGIGGIAQSIGGGLMGINAQQNQMKALQQMYPSGGVTSAAQGFRRFALQAGANPLIDFKANISTRYPSATGASGYSSFLNPQVGQENYEEMPGRQKFSGTPMMNTAPYQAPMIFPYQQQTDFSNLLNP